MLRSNMILRRIAALTLALLLLLFTGCGPSNEPAAATPEPSQALTTPEPTPEQTPEPETAASPTDVNAPTGLPVPELSIERQVPEYLQLLTLGASFTLTNADGETLIHSGTETSGTMGFTQQQLSEGNVFSVLIPYSTSFTFETTGTSGDWGIEIIGSGSTAYNWCHCVARGSGKLDGLEYKTGAGLTVRTEPGAALELTLPMADSSLGENGWVRLHLTAGESEVGLSAEGSSFSFSGVDTGAPVLVDFGGVHSASGLDLAPDSSSGDVFFGTTGEGEISLNDTQS